ncbi:MAG: hypothetical protein L0211_09190 [Planctomycetaceae bacterium]|nr:hypothetical protein [Planctomycetaceae bacterium]
MPTYLENLTAARNTLAAALATNAGRPNYNIDGESIDFGELMDRLKKLDDAIATAQGPVEVETQGLV